VLLAVRVLLPLLLVIGVLLAVRYTLLEVLRGAGDRQRAVPARWIPAHLEKAGTTVVVVRRVAIQDGRVLDERVVQRVRVDDPDYDQRFLEAMATARSRAALYRSEEELP